jgi:hypothetical protein
MGRVSRSTKKLAQRIDLNYFKRLYPIPRWRRILSFGCVAAGLVWLGWGALAGKQEAFNPGRLAHSHALFTRNCAVCHAAKSAFGLKVTDQACLACHDGATHQAQQTFTPACTECHVEHQGASWLGATRDESCTQCHSNLKTKNGTTLFAAKITSFENGHPDFAAVRAPDPGTIKFGHAIHLKSDLRGPHGTVQLKCGACHSPAGGYMAPVTYEKHCASCHSLAFDARFSEPAPHKKPEVVIDFVTQKFTEYIAKHPDEVHLADPPDPRILRPPMPPARDAQEWIERRIADTKVLLWRKTCVECHTLNFGGNRVESIGAAPLPSVPEAAIPSRWMKHSFFNHTSHQMLICAECHTRAAVSEKASDVMIPGIDTCRECHHSGSDAAESRCFECHLYHDRTESKVVDGTLKISAMHP